MSDKHDTITARELADRWGCSRWTVYQKVANERLPHQRIGKRGKLLFSWERVERWMLEHGSA